MKKVISSALALFVLFSFTSCNKSVEIVDPAIHTAQIVAWIYPNINQPSDAVLGESSAQFSVGDRVVVYVPYQVANDEISEADLVIKDDLGEYYSLKQLQVSVDPVAEGLNVPAELQGKQFMYGVIEVEDAFANKNLTLSVEVRGINSGYSTDKIDNAFTVFP
jgi:hypothetical protein